MGSVFNFGIKKTNNLHFNTLLLFHYYYFRSAN